MSQPYVITVILNTNRRDDTLECLASLEKGTYPHHKIIVLDNASVDGSVEAISNAYPSVELIHLRENLGYAGNNNVGVRAAIDQGADWVFVLNEDTVLDPECLTRMVNAAEPNPAVGVVGPMVYHHDEPDVIQSAGGVLGPNWEGQHLTQNERDVGQWPKPHRVEWISGCAILIRRSVIQQIGLLDERFFYYWEELDWCVRATHAGWQCLQVPSAKLWHKGVQRNYQPKPSLSYYNTRNRLLLLEKHQAPWRVKAGAWLQILRTLMSYSIRPKWRAKRDHRDAQWRGLVDFLFRRWGQARL